mmetsp:Transcript_24250/g.59857  ORF Transcript_24250/g.59857 Transcript_24250/m.59857 type:complete len:275 (+) Transcript_24250:11594-12418(+)
MDAVHDELIDFFLVRGHQGGDRIVHLGTTLRVCPDGLEQCHGEGVVELGLVRRHLDAVRHAELQALQIPNLFEECDDLLVVVDDQLVVVVAILMHVEDAAADVEALDVLDVLEPVVEDDHRVELLGEGVAVLLQLLPFDVLLPALAQHVFYSAHIHLEPSLELLRPNDGARCRRDVPDGGHLGGLCAGVVLLELVLQLANVILDLLDERRLVLLDGPPDTWAEEERVEAREDAEHLGGRLGGAKPVAQLGCDLALGTVDLVVIRLLGLLPGLSA